MSLESKYIVIDNNVEPLTMIIFPPWCNHKEIAINLKVLDFVISAGFINKISKFEEDPYCYGRSSSLNINSNPEIDDIILKSMLYDD